MAVQITLLCHIHSTFVIDQGLVGQPVAQINLLTAGHLEKCVAKSPTQQRVFTKNCAKDLSLPIAAS